MKSNLVVKSNRLVEASYRLTLAEQRIILLAIVEARRTGKGLNADDFVDIQAAEYAEIYGLALNQAYEQIKEAARTLFYREFILYDTHPDTGKARVIKSRWLSAASYIDGAGAVQLQFSGVIVPYITRLEAEFTRYKLEKVAHMSSAYAIRLYELLLQWGSVGTREIELDWLKQALMVEQDYPRMFDFKKRVLDVALFQINEYSDLTAHYTQRKTGRNVTHLTFTFAPKEETPPAPASPPQPPANLSDSPLFQRLREHGVGARLAAAWLKQDAARAQAAVDYVEAKARGGQVKGSTAGYLRAVYESGAALGPSVFEVKLQAQAKAAAAEKQRAEAERRAQARADREALERARVAVRALTAQERLSLADDYRQGEGATRSASWEAAKGDFRDPLERIQFSVWLQTKFRAAQRA